MLKIDILSEIDQYPICDTDIWVNMSLAKVCSRAFNKYKKVIFADIVELEIKEWNRDTNYSFIATDFDESKKLNTAFVIYHLEHIEEDDRDFMTQQLKELNFQYGLDKREKDKGEVVSAIYADHFGITVIKSNDSYLKSSGFIEKEFPDLIVKSWSDVSEELSESHSDLMQIRKSVDDRRPAMNNSFTVQKAVEKKEEILQKLQDKFNNKRN